ncbi:hypothetical protein GCM10010448_42640 [Streptomyces glomeratus]|uniref:Uncharacterized protein n=1 Tax=Streptomyces glomeratus TaxID=284452 RepID=A0ABP6LSH3_9ACTN
MQPFPVAVGDGGTGADAEGGTEGDADGDTEGEADGEAEGAAVRDGDPPVPAAPPSWPPHPARSSAAAATRVVVMVPWGVVRRMGRPPFLKPVPGVVVPALL